MPVNDLTIKIVATMLPEVQELLREHRSLLVRADSLISLLRHRQEGVIQWDTPHLNVTLREVDQLIGDLRRASGRLPENAHERE